jgi:hypothetical protein
VIETVNCRAFFGHIKVATRMRPEGSRIIGEGRSWHYDGDNNLIKDTGWQRTGIELFWEEPKQRHWWPSN